MLEVRGSLELAPREEESYTPIGRRKTGLDLSQRRHYPGGEGDPSRGILCGVDWLKVEAEGEFLRRHFLPSNLSIRSSVVVVLKICQKPPGDKDLVCGPLSYVEGPNVRCTASCSSQTQSSPPLPRPVPSGRVGGSW